MNFQNWADKLSETVSRVNLHRIITYGMVLTVKNSEIDSHLCIHMCTMNRPHSNTNKTIFKIFMCYNIQITS